jgi:hypothetical protein
MPTRAASNEPAVATPVVATRRQLERHGLSRHRIQAQLEARRWSQHGQAIVRHNGPLTRDEKQAVALVNCGPRSLLTSFTAAALWGLTGWTREEIHVLAPGGTTRPPRDRPGRDPAPLARLGPGRSPSGATSASLGARPGGRRRELRPRPLGVRADGGRGAATVGPGRCLRAAVLAAPRARHRNALLLAVDDIDQGAEALSEIDFVRLCRRNGLPPPDQQAVRRDSTGRRRYLDATWRLRDGRLLVVEVDGALHLVPRRWWDDQLRQNDLTLEGMLVLRFPSAVVRHEEALVVRQLRRALDLHAP